MTKNDLLESITKFGRKTVAFEPAPADNDDDELARAINDPIYHDNRWDLHEAVDGEALEKFWEDATKELGSDSFTE